MNEISPEISDSTTFRHAIESFIQERKEAKLNGKEDADIAAKYEYETWLAGAAKRAGQIQIVTHVLKATHPDARGSSLRVDPADLPQHDEVGSHQIGPNFAEDVVGNAAALDVYKLLKLEVRDRRLLDWMLEDNAELNKALHSDAETASEWVNAFKSILSPDGDVASHVRAKQIYWLVGEDPGNNDDYHLLQPMFSSSLAHTIHSDIQDARFGDENKEARKAFRNKGEYSGIYRNYRNLVARKLGGTKPQNISQLNSERGGINYLLGSLPPKWHSDDSFKLVITKSAIDQLHSYRPIRNLVDELADFLRDEPPANDKTRRTRQSMEQDLGAQLALFAAAIQERFPAGWSRDADCELSLCEKLWLDPERTELVARNDPDYPEHTEEDLEFNHAFVFGDWPDEVASRFANWVNERLRGAGLATVGDAEHRHWAKQAVVDAAWPIPMHRRPASGDNA